MRTARTISSLPLLFASLAPLAAAQAVTPPARAGVPLYRAIDLGIAGGFTESAATDVNDARQVTGYLTTGQAFPSAFLWLPRPDHGLPAGMTVLGTLSGSSQSTGSLIDDCGRVIGTAIRVNGPLDLTLRSFVWQDGVMAELGSVDAEADTWSVVVDVNDRGTLAGWSDVLDDAVYTRPMTGTFACGSAPMLAGLGSEPGYASDVNERDEIVGTWVEPSLLGGRAFFFDPAGGFVELPVLPGMTWSAANGLDGRGMLVAGSSSRLEAGAIVQHAVIWRRTLQGWQVVDLGRFDGASFNSANAIDEERRVYGSSTQPGESTTPWVWVGGTFHDVNDLVVGRRAIRIETTSGRNGRGDLAAIGRDAEGEIRGYLLVRLR